jgi:hypothetical protein
VRESSCCATSNHRALSSCGVPPCGLHLPHPGQFLADGRHAVPTPWKIDVYITAEGDLLLEVAGAAAWRLRCQRSSRESLCQVAWIPFPWMT